MKKAVTALLLCAAMLTGTPLLSFAQEANPAPTVIPAVREWTGGTGSYVPDGDTVIRYPAGDADTEKRVEIIKGYFEDMFSLTVSSSTDTAAAGEGDIILTLDGSDSDTLGEDGYVLEISDRVNITAPSAQGLFYGMVTVVQSYYADGAVPCGKARDYAYYPIRSGMIDVARAYIPLEYVEEITKYFAYFKLNEIHLHINDIGQNGYNIFRLESDVEGLTATDGYYTKDEYRAYQKRMLDYGVTVITEIDTPAHSACFASVVPELMLDANHLDISKPETVEFVKSLFDEYITGDDPVFVSRKVHIGTDEYPVEYSEIMRAYINELIEFVNSRGYTPRFWGSFGNDGFNGTTPVSSEAETNFWAVSLSDYKTLFDMGYDVINTCGPVLYVVPGGNYGFADRYDLEYLYSSWFVNYMGTDASTAVDPDHEQLKGASFALWNDLHTAYGGFSFFDIIDRLRGMVCLISEKTWCGEQTRDIEASDFVARYEKLSLRAGDANPMQYAQLPIEGDVPEGVDAVGFPYLASIEVCADSYGDSASIFSGSVGTLYVGADGQLGFRREVYDFSFDYTLPLGEWVKLTLYADNKQTVLIVDDTYYYHPQNNKNPSLCQSSTFVLPLEEICKGFDGQYRNLRVEKNDVNLEELRIDCNFAKNMTVTSSSVELDLEKFAPSKAVDGDPNTRLSFSASSDNQWMIVDLGEERTVNRIEIDFFEHISDYKVYVSTDGENYTEILHIQSGEDGKRQTDVHEFDPVSARYIKYEQLKRFYIADWNAWYSGGICEFGVYGFDDTEYKDLLEKTSGCDDPSVRAARAELESYLDTENAYLTHAAALRDTLEELYAAYVSGPETSSDGASSSAAAESSSASSAAPESSSGALPYIIGAAILAAAAVITAVVLKRKKK